MLPSVLRYAPAVFAVKNEYLITVPVHASILFWVRVGEHTYYDESNGILRSDTELHRVRVPMEVLDAAGKYTICWREVSERKPYFSVVGDEQSATFAFRPIKQGPIRAYMIADAHGMFDGPTAAARRFEAQYGKLDLLILNGDILDHSGEIENFMLYYRLADELTAGEIPTVISRGNHDLRGRSAERLADFMPNENGNSFYSFRLGCLWGILLDCGEDKSDDHAEYGGTICCHAFRERETDYLQTVLKNAEDEYAAEGVKHRIVLSHVPFTQIDEEPFDIEQDTYRNWVKLLNEQIRPEVLLSGHKHQMYITMPNDPRDAYGMTFPTVVGSEPRAKDHYYAGCGIVWQKDQIKIVFNDGDRILKETIL